jgi:DICT domain-containing protein
VHPSPYEIVAAHVPSQRRTKRDLLAASRLVEQQALAAGAHTVLVTFQDRRHVTAASRASYAGIARAGATVYAFARGLVSDYAPASTALMTVALMPDDALVSEWDIVVLTSTGGSAFVARDLTPGAAVGGADLERSFAWTRTDDPRLVADAADALLARVP